MDLRRSEFDLETIVRRIKAGELDLQPDFQRGEIWDRKRRQRLIDSLLRDWYVPAVHIVRGRGDALETVLDGQQRLAAIRDFFEDQFPVDGTILPYSEEIQQLHGCRFSQLPSHVRQSLQRFPLPCVTLREFHPEEPNELFFRLNQSYNLTPPEKRNALHGEARRQVKEVVDELESIGLLQRDVIGFSNGRLAYDDIVARTCLALQRGDLRQHINNNVVEDFYRNSEFTDGTLTSVVRAGQDLLNMCGKQAAKLRFNKATLFSWLVFCYWAPIASASQLPSDLLANFEDHRLAIKRNDPLKSLPKELVGVISLYDDRASYRVTDVSSVLARDCALYLYLQSIFGAPPINHSDALLAGLMGTSETHTQQLILEFASATGWGRLPKTGPIS